MIRTCPSCGHLNRPQAIWCESCKKGLNLKSRLAEPWAKTGPGSRITTTWALFAGGGCLFFFVFPPLGVFLLGIAVVTQFLMKKSIPGVCPHCGQDTGTIRAKGAQPDFPCLHCRQLIHLDSSSGKPLFVRPAGDADGAQGPSQGSLPSSRFQPGASGKADWRGIDLSLGHPRVKLETEGGEATYAVTLAHDMATVRWRVLPFVGWTWTLPAGRGTRVFLAHRGGAVHDYYNGSGLARISQPIITT